MRMIDPDGTTIHPRRLRWSEVKRNIAKWHRRARSRNRPISLSDELRDTDASRRPADAAVSKLFWTE